jgi:type IV secretory pathway TrbD component
VAFVLAMLMLVGGVLAAGVWWLDTRGIPTLFGVCQAVVGDTTVRLQQEQAEIAATIAAVALQRDLPPRAVSIALATAMQESGLRNLDYGDRDSLGVFQQRPSQGWGTPQQVRDVTYATNRFFDALVQLPYEQMSINDAAQAVQRSGFPDHYAKHEPRARALASALTGYSPATFTCQVQADAGLAAEQPSAAGYTPRAAAVRRELRTTFEPAFPGGLDLTTYQTAEGSNVHDLGLAVDVWVPMLDGAGSPQGWQVAHWLVANAARLDVAVVIYDDKIWSARRSGQGWRDYQHPSGSTTITDRHLDHIHVDVIPGG